MDRDRELNPERMAQKVVSFTLPSTRTPVSYAGATQVVRYSLNCKTRV